MSDGIRILHDHVVPLYIVHGLHAIETLNGHGRMNLDKVPRGSGGLYGATWWC